MQQIPYTNAQNPIHALLKEVRMSLNSWYVRIVMKKILWN